MYTVLLAKHWLFCLTSQKNQRAHSSVEAHWARTSSQCHNFCFSNSSHLVGTLQFCIISRGITVWALAPIQKKTKTTTNGLQTSLGITVLNVAVSTLFPMQYSSQCTLKGFMEIHLSSDASEAEYYHPHKWSLYQEGKKARRYHQSAKFPNKHTGNGRVQDYQAEKGDEASWPCTADTVFLCCRSWLDSM